MATGAFLRESLYLGWLHFKRAPRFKGKFALKIMSGLVGIYLLLNLLVLGYVIDIPLKQYFPQMHAVTLANQYLLAFLILLMVLGFFLEKLPRLAIHSFLCLPIAKKSIALSYLLRLLVSKLNLAPILIVIPFWIKNVSFFPSLVKAVCWLLGFLLLRVSFRW